MREKSKKLAHKLAECVHACSDCFAGCLEEDDVKMMRKCIQLNKECAEICNATLALVYKNSHFSKESLSLCKKACKACGDECRKHTHDHCKECARICDECLQACDEFMQ